MNVSVKCFAQLAKSDQCDYRGSTPHTVPAGARVNDLIGTLGFQNEDVKLIFVNNVNVSPETLLREGDKVAFAPATGGM